MVSVSVLLVGWGIRGFEGFHRGSCLEKFLSRILGVVRKRGYKRQEYVLVAGCRGSTGHGGTASGVPGEGRGEDGVGIRLRGYGGEDGGEKGKERRTE